MNSQKEFLILRTIKNAMIRSIIIDDELHCIKALTKDLKENCSNVEVVASCPSAKEGVLAIKKIKPQLIFLDVEMPWMNGFEMLEMLEHIDFCIIFTTAYDKFAAKAFRISAVDYLLKPIDANDLKIAVQKAEEKIMSSTGAVNIQNLLQNIRQPAQQQKIALPNREGYEFAQVNSILYCTAEGSYTKIIFNNKHTLLISKTLGEYDALLTPHNFIRTHKSHLVNRKFISFIDHDGFVVLKDNTKVEVSRRRKEEVMTALK